MAFPAKSDKAAKMMEQIVCAVKDRPDVFVLDVLGADPTAQQIQALQAMCTPGAKVTIRSGHNTGKTTFLAWIILWFLLTRYDCKVPCTAPSSGQLRDALWPEMVKWREVLPPAFAYALEITQDRVYLKDAPEMCFAVARTARREKPEALAGFHASSLMFLVDESSGVDEKVFEVARASLSNPGASVVMTGNPTRLQGFFYDSHHSHRERWTPLHWSCLDSPLPDEDYARDVIKDYGEDSNYYKVRVLGDFPNAESDQFISLEELEEAVRREVGPEGKHVWGVDPAYLGDNECCLAKRQGLVVHEVIGKYGMDTMETAGWIMNEYEAAEDKPQKIVVDKIGIGAGVFDRLREMKYPVVGCNVAERSSDKARYLNLRAELWDKLKKFLHDGKIPNDNKLIGQASCAKYHFPSGKLAIESKMDMRKRGVVSPDRADAVMLSLFSGRVNAWGTPLNFQ